MLKVLLKNNVELKFLVPDDLEVTMEDGALIVYNSATKETLVYSNPGDWVSVFWEPTNLVTTSSTWQAGQTLKID